MNQKDTLIAIRRLEQFNLRANQNIISESVPLSMAFALSSEPVRFEDRLSLTYAPIEQGAIWGRSWESAWFNLKGTIPDSWRGKTVVAQLDLGGEGLVVLPDGKIIQGITNGSVFATDFGRDIVRLAERCDGGEQIELWVEAAANGLFGMFCDLDPGPNSTNRYGYYDAKVSAARLGVFDTQMWHLTLDLKVLLDLAKSLPAESVRAARIISCAIEGLNAYAKSGENPQIFREIIKAELSKPANASSLAVTAVGHAHIDTAWLWPVKETIRKCARTFATQLDLIGRYPQYIFGASQAQHYDFAKKNYPALYERIKKAVKDGQWEIQGGMWVEADCNIIGGESLVRQILYGKNYFKDEFDVDIDNLWLPDVFGYSGALPQILRKSGINYFLTQKLSWNQINEFPYHTFMWEGIDGSQVLTHFPPENTYNGQLAADSLVNAESRFKEKDIIDEYISLFGVGDGGGGPKEEYIQTGLRMANLEGAPRVKFGTARDFFHRLDGYKDRLSTWVGELYLELHRGTLTTQAYVKWANRRLEHKLKALEMLGSCLPVEQYSQSQLDAVWKIVLLNQFHDIIPGSSIWRVYRVTHEEYNQALKQCDDIQNALGSALLSPDSNCITLFNCLHYPFDGIIVLPETWKGCVESDGKEVSIQSEGESNIAHVRVEPYSFSTLTRSAATVDSHSPRSGMVLENRLVRYEFSNQGTLINCVDKENNRVIVSPENPANLLTLYEDRPNYWDAWDIDSFYQQTPLESARVIKIEPGSSGKVRQSIRFSYSIGQSHIEQRVCLGAFSKRLDFETTVDWHEKHRMLRVAFPVNVRSEQASFDIQYGYVKRSTHRNTSWEQARFEVTAHKYADLSDQDHGVALLNDSKYGHRVENGLLDLNLLRSPNYPDPDADQDTHHFTYSLLPHTGDLIHSDVISEAAQLNQGLMMFTGFKKRQSKIPVSITGEGLSMEVVKKAEKEDCLILRIVETQGRQSTGMLFVDSDRATIEETDLMEWAEGNRIPVNKTLELGFMPFEIRTYKLRLNSN